MSETQSAYLIEATDQREWWPYRAVPVSMGGGFDSLWLLADPGEDIRLFSRVATAWTHLAWFAMGTWYQADTAARRGFSDRYDTVLKCSIARAELQVVGGGALFSEWAIVNPVSKRLHDVLSAVRRSRGKGGCLALAHSDDCMAVWHALSFGALWRAVTSRQANDFHRINDLVLSSYLTEAVVNDLYPIVPLDYHPSAGYVIFGRAEQLVSMAEMISDLEVFDAEEAVMAIYAAGGGLAL